MELRIEKVSVDLTGFVCMSWRVSQALFSLYRSDDSNPATFSSQERESQSPEEPGREGPSRYCSCDYQCVVLMSCAQRRRAATAAPKDTNFEHYRKHKLCPIKGCASAGRPLKKLANHMQAVHSDLSRKERTEALRKAKVVPKRLVPGAIFAASQGKRVSKALASFR